MKTKQTIGCAFALILTLAMTACGGGKTLNSPEALKAYLDSQPANSPDKPIKVSMTINDPMLKDVAGVIRNTNKYVSLNITGNLLTTIPESAFGRCKMLAGITLPSSVTSIGAGAFSGCTSLKSITIPSNVTSIRGCPFNYWEASQTINIQGKANREETIAAGWDDWWDRGGLDGNHISAKINYKK